MVYVNFYCAALAIYIVAVNKISVQKNRKKCYLFKNQINAEYDNIKLT